jgi:hypothetical protein
VVVLHNFSSEPQEVAFHLDDAEDAVALDDLLDNDTRKLDGPELAAELPAYGYRWFRLRRRGKRIVP